MTILVVGASGATGRLLVEQLLKSGHMVRVIVRNTYSLPEEIRVHKSLTIKEASILDLDNEALQGFVADCDAVASCLGHNPTFKGVFGHPRRLVTEAIKRLCMAVMVSNPKIPVKFLLMNTAGNSNRDLNEKISFGQKIIISLIRLLIPPQVDNELAADYLRTEIGQSNKLIEWSVVRPDSLINQESISDYDAYPSPIRSAIFNPGKTSRINVAHFMADLITNNKPWNKWKGQMPVIYNKEFV